MSINAMIPTGRVLLSEPELQNVDLPTTKPSPAKTLADLPPAHIEMLRNIRAADTELTSRFQKKMHVNNDLDRTLVSFQANRNETGHRWC